MLWITAHTPILSHKACINRPEFFFHSFFGESVVRPGKKLVPELLTLYRLTTGESRGEKTGGMGVPWGCSWSVSRFR